MRVAWIYRHSFLADVLSPASVVVDLGMNRGGFSDAVAERFGCRVVGVEPVPSLYESLPDLPRVTTEQTAVTADGGTVLLHLNRGTDATVVPGLADSDADAVEVPATTFGDLLRRHDVDRVTLAKVDIEGAEVDLLMRLAPETLAVIDQLTVEFHDFLDPDQRPSVQAVIRRLKREGFVVLKFSRDNTDVLFVNQRALPLSRRQLVWLRLRYKYPRGARRVVRRLLRRS